MSKPKDEEIHLMLLLVQRSKMNKWLKRAEVTLSDEEYEADAVLFAHAISDVREPLERVVAAQKQMIEDLEEKLSKVIPIQQVDITAVALSAVKALVMELEEARETINCLEDEERDY